MPLFSDHISNMYYSGTPSYTSSTYNYSSSVSPYGSSYSASYLNPGGNYSSHSSLGGYSRTPLTSRWLTSGGRVYSPILSTISEKGTSSPVRINSPRRIPITSRTYIPSTYTPRPININTADIDVSRDKYRSKLSDSNSTPLTGLPPRRSSPIVERDNGHDKPDTGIDSSPGSHRSTIKRDRTVVRLHTIKRKERDSPRKSYEDSRCINDDCEKQSEQVKWREKLASDLAYKSPKEKKSLGAKLVEKFTLKDKDDSEFINITKRTPPRQIDKEILSESQIPNETIASNKSLGRRCSMELLAEQASLLDSLIRRENLSTVPLDLSKIGSESLLNFKDTELESNKKRKLSDQENPLTTTKSDHSLHARLSTVGLKDPKHGKRRSLRKSSSGGSICKLDRITELPQNTTSMDTSISSIPETKETNKICKKETNKHSKLKIKTKITSTVEVTTPPSPLKFIVEQVTVEEKPVPYKKGIIFSSTVDEEPTANKVVNLEVHRKSIKLKTKQKPEVNQNNSKEIISKTEKIGHRKSFKSKKIVENYDINSPEPDDGNFWDKIGKRETIYLISRKQNIDEAKEKSKRLYWFPENEESDIDGINYKESINLEKNTIENNEDVKETIISTNEVLNLVPILEEKQVKTSIDNKQSNETNTDKEIKAKKSLCSEDKNCKVNDNYNNKVSNLTDSNYKTLSLEKNTEILPISEIKDSSPECLIYLPKDKLNKKSKEEIKLLTKIDKNKMEERNTDIQSKNVALTTDTIANASKNLIETTSLYEHNVSNDIVNPINTEVDQMSLLNKNLVKICTESNVTEHEKLITVDCEIKENKPGETKCEEIITKVDSGTKDVNEIISEETRISEKLAKSIENDGLNSLAVKSSSLSNDNSADSVNIPTDNCKYKSSISKSIEKNTNDETKKMDTKPDREELPSSSSALSVARPVKKEKAPIVLIATPRPLQKKKPHVINSSSSSESSDDETSDDENDDDESESSEASAEFFECENNPDGRTSTGSNDSGFDSSVPTSPSGFLCTKKGGDNPSTSTGSTASQTYTHDVLEQELEHSKAYELFRKTGRFTPPARFIPRFRKYTIEDFQFIKVLGKGSFGKVMLAELRDTEYYYAVKCLKKDVVLEDDDVECTLIERKVLALGTNHPYLCHLFATFQTDSHLFFVMEYLNGGDLMFHIQQSGRFPEARARFYAAEIVSGLKFLHKRGIVYRDLKLDNILLDFDGHVRIADFGMCKLQIYLDKTADTFCGTPDYMAPEIIKGLKYSQTVDWWSFGVLLYEMLIGQSPFSGCDEDELFWSICNEMPSYPRFLSSEALSILTRLLDKDARTRLGGAECMHGDIRDQDFFHPVQWDRLERRELDAPFKPRVRHPMDTQYFDRAFTGERPRLTAVEPQVLKSMDQEPFRGFSYTNPNATDR
ncbi:probable serine/threonine-protein kinase DDB_G0278845 isoform X2 [Nymphalis io]|uniref:probable serine/threonine-protein kinase DDB_G0278845 isoform X2 n=1 Tax=Inachis io TaxID=171585 RepID=UPI002169ED34|nr:probable serine/threonine-protein kinase DDB_G0278845 isoform X2 [Nymphalis io]